MTRLPLILLVSFALSVVTALSCASTQNPLVEMALDRGDEFFETERFEEAISEYTKAIEIDPENAIAYNNRGVAHYKSLKNDGYEKAMADYDKAISLDPDFVTAYINRGNAHTNYSRDHHTHQFWVGLGSAIKDYSEAIRLEPDNALFYYKRGSTYHNLAFAYPYYTEDERRRDIGRAIEDYDKVISLAPDNYARAYANRGAAYYKMDEYERAIEDYNKAISLQADFLMVYYGRGLANLRLGNTSEMRSDMAMVVELGFFDDLLSGTSLEAILGYGLPGVYISEGGFYFIRALARLQRADYDNAVADMDMARNLIDPQLIHLYSDEMHAVYFQSGIAYYDTGLYDDAITLFDKAIDVVASPSDYPDAYYQRGMSHYRKGSYRRAMADFDMLAGLEQDYPNAVHYRQMSQEKLLE